MFSVPLCFACPSPGISHFSKGSWFPSLSCWSCLSEWYLDPNPCGLGVLTATTRVSLLSESYRGPQYMHIYTHPCMQDQCLFMYLFVNSFLFYFIILFFFYFFKRAERYLSFHTTRFILVLAPACCLTVTTDSFSGKCFLICSVLVWADSNSRMSKIYY